MARTKEIAHEYRLMIIGVLWTAYVVIYLQRLSIGPLAPFLKEDMGITSTQVGSLMSATSFGYLLVIVPAGWAADRIGVRWLLVIGELVGGILIVGMFFSPSYWRALTIMTMVGFGSGCLMPATTKAVMTWFPMRERATAMGFKQTGVNVGGIITAMALPAVALALGWRFGFLFIAILAIAIGIFSFVMYKDPPMPAAPRSMHRAAHTDIARPAMGQLLIELLTSRDIWLVAIAGFALVLVEFAVIAHLVLYLTEALLFPVVAAGVILAVTEAGGALGKPGGGFLSDRFFGGSRRTVYILWGGIACAMCILITLWGATLSWALYPILFTLGVTSIGWGGVHLTLVAELAGSELVGTATGVVSVITVVGMILGPILFGYIVDASDSYQLAWLSLTVFAAICVAALLFVREERRRI
ncbi:MFS transporter [Chloroflexota bacterium]